MPLGMMRIAGSVVQKMLPISVRNLAARLQVLDTPDYGMGKEVPGLIPGQLDATGRGSGWMRTLRPKVGDRVFMDHLRGGVYARIVSVSRDEIIGRVVATKGIIQGVFIDEIIRVPAECIARVLKA